MREYHALKVFFDTCGRWPKREDGPLATWCYTQRERRKDGRLSKERIRALNEIGFVWNQNLQGEWMKNYEELKSLSENIGVSLNRRKGIWADGAIHNGNA